MTAEALADRLRAGFPGYTRAERAVASWMLANLTRLPFETAATVAEAVGVSPMTVGRFLRGLGYGNLAELKRDLRSGLDGRSLPIADRVARLGEGAEAGERLRGNFELEVEALLAVYELVGTPAWRRTVRRVARARRIFAAGFQTLEGVASGFAQRLAYLRPGVGTLDGRDGVFADLLEGPEPGEAALVLLEMRRYTRVSRLLAEEALARGVGVTIVCDAHCAWVHEIGGDALVVPTDTRLFWDGQAPFVSLLNLLLDDVARLMEPEVAARTARLGRLQERFGAFEP